MDVEHPRAILRLSLVAAFMVFVDATIVNLTLAQLARDLHATRTGLEWVVNAYTLSFAAAMLGAGALADVCGADRTLLAGLAVFTASSAIGGAAGSVGVLDVARLVQGAGAALMLPSALVLATRAAVGDESRQRLLGWWAAAGGLGMASGPILGGVLVALGGWRAVFWVNVVLGIPAVAYAARAIPRAPRRSRRLDTWGQLTATLLIGGLVFALVETPALGGMAGPVVGAWAAAGVGLIGFVVAERASRSPLLPRAVYRDVTFVSAGLQGALFNFAFYGLLFAMGLMFQQGRHLDAFVSGLLFLPLTGAIPLASTCAASLARRLGRRRLLLAGHVALTASLALIALAADSAALWPLLLALVPAGFSGGLLVPTMTAQSLTTVDRSAHGAASAAFNTARQLGSAIGVAALGPLLGATSLTAGFQRCVLAGAAATFAAVALARASPVIRRSDVARRERTVVPPTACPDRSRTSCDRPGELAATTGRERPLDEGPGGCHSPRSCPVTRREIHRRRSS
jgi:DHA2 family methylenomycin A resistance protein-like MFS transporter